MALTAEQYNSIMREYELKRAYDRDAAKKRQEEIYGRHPRLIELENEARSLSLRRAELLLYNNGDGEEEKEKLQALYKEKEAILEKEGVYDEDYTPSYYCPDCKDTGYIGTQKCHCFRQAEIDLIYKQSTLKRVLERENFDHFSLECYSDRPINEKGEIPREMAAAAQKTCRDFVETFDKDFRNLLFIGDTGVGKTFLSNCVAKELLDRGHSVIYFTATRLFDILEKDVFRKKELQNEGIPEDYYPSENRRNIYEAELLVIDDLGTEMINSFTITQLTACVNERLLRERSTIISTNLKIAQIPEYYSMRIFSRFVQNYTVIPLIGEDIRFRKQA